MKGILLEPMEVDSVSNDPSVQMKQMDSLRLQLVEPHIYNFQLGYVFHRQIYCHRMTFTEGKQK